MMNILIYGILKVNLMMTDENLEKAYKALEKWKQTVTVESFIQDHKRLSITELMKFCDEIGEEHNFKSRLGDLVICTKCGRYRKNNE